MWRKKGFLKPIFAGGDPSPFVEFTLRCPRCRVWGTIVSALVDTGSPFTGLTPRDIVRLQLPLSKLRPAGRPISLGGYWFVPKLLTGAELIFKDEEGKRHSLPYGSFYILEPRCPKDKWDQNLYKYPNIIGMDFLRKMQVRIHLDPSRDEFVLEFRD
ncbi:MAG: hypothetical protein DSO04_03125 [Hadesarchaea archaeon]|nr:MAG: hypothetical protein DSO04_03125 [Hadesarchaea archaeon]